MNTLYVFRLCIHSLWVFQYLFVSVLMKWKKLPFPCMRSRCVCSARILLFNKQMKKTNQNGNHVFRQGEQYNRIKETGSQNIEWKCVCTCCHYIDCVCVCVGLRLFECLCLLFKFNRIFYLNRSTLHLFRLQSFRYTQNYPENDIIDYIQFIINIYEMHYFRFRFRLSHSRRRSYQSWRTFEILSISKDTTFQSVRTHMAHCH